jgi:hypothetical protein
MPSGGERASVHSDAGMSKQGIADKDASRTASSLRGDCLVGHLQRFVNDGEAFV